MKIKGGYIVGKVSSLQSKSNTNDGKLLMAASHSATPKFKLKAGNCSTLDVPSVRSVFFSPSVSSDLLR